ncbi:MAG TPA: metalloregulator ArsR/SmtB family transcription factor [Dongiaceae bacterium]|jgi:predicted ArsR family transcriptional regulator
MEARGPYRLLYAIKAAGPQSAEALGRKLGMTPVGARQHLGRLHEEGLVDFEDRKDGVGRPKRVWFLTDAGNARFPDNHAGLTLEMIEAVRKIGGETMLDEIIGVRERKTLRNYRSRLEGAASLKEKVARLAKIRSEEGYMASSAAAPEGGMLLVENHCPICVAAKSCQGFCRSELQLFRAALGSGVSVERIEHLLDGARRCVYRIVERNGKVSG